MESWFVPLASCNNPQHAEMNDVVMVTHCFSFLWISHIPRSDRLNLKIYSERSWKISVGRRLNQDDAGNINRARSQKPFPSSHPLSEPWATGPLGPCSQLPVVLLWRFFNIMALLSGIFGPGFHCWNPINVLHPPAMNARFWTPFLSPWQPTHRLSGCFLA